MKTGKIQKMKLTGYICLAFAALVGLAMLFGLAEETPGMEIMKYWGVTGISLLTINAGKRITGSIAMAKNETWTTKP